MKMSLFGKRLHSQIVWPLMLTSVAISVVATVVVVGILGGVIERWADESANVSADLLVSRVERRGAEMQRRLTLVAANPWFTEHAENPDPKVMMDALLDAYDLTDADTLMMLDETGAVVASVGALGLGAGERPFDDGAGRALPLEPHPGVRTIAGRYAVTAAVPLEGAGSGGRTLVEASVINNEYMGHVVGGLSSGIAFLDEDNRIVAAAAPDRVGGEDLVAALVEDAPEVVEAVGSLIEKRSTSRDFEVGGSKYRIAARDFRFPGDSAAPRVRFAAIVGINEAVATRATTIRLILLWSVVAVIGLIALNWWVARSVSDPLADLAASVARVAEGDFSTKVVTGGSHEVAALTENFNTMTDSLRERSESLTKKVLELATLYEMSRALGATLDLDTLLDSVLDSAMRIFGVDLGYVTMVDADTGANEVRVWRGTNALPPGDAGTRSPLSEWVIREGRPLIFNPSQAEDGGGRTDAVTGARAALSVPLLSSEGTLGAITVGSSDPEQRFTSDDVRLLATIANHVTIAIGNIGLFSNVQEAYLATVRALAAAVDAKDPYTRGHSDGVAAFALMIGTALELSPDQMVALEMAAYLHDIGKIGISEDILLKPGKLTEAEMSRMRHHPLIGANILKPVAFPWPIAPIVRHHHEHFNGEGYPAGLRSEEIPLLARVLTVADAFEAMIADRPYRRGRSQQEAILELRRCSGTHFDPRVVEAFIQALESLEAMPVDGPASGLDIGPEEVQAVFAAVCDGMYASFRRLGGPRLATNLEQSVNERLLADGVPLGLKAGHLVIEGDGGLSDEVLETHLRCAVTVIAESIEVSSGAGLADHFLGEALAGLPERMRAHAAELGLDTAT